MRSPALQALRQFAPRRVAAVVLLAALAVSTWAGVVDFSPGLLKLADARLGRDAPKRLLGWQQSVHSQQTPVDGASRRPELQLLEATNLFWNRIPYVEDQAHWGLADYWATPAETVGSHGADCEDYAIAKYFLLKELGVPVSRLRITYVRATRIDEPHMVLAYYSSASAEPLILDNLDDFVRSASARKDLTPVYSFNDEDVVLVRNNQRGNVSQIRNWHLLNERLRAEAAM